MRYTRIFGASSTGAPWKGIAEATFAIIFTLLVIELPIMIIEILDKGSSHASYPELLMSIGILVLGYFFIYAILYDVWAFHKGLLERGGGKKTSEIITLFFIWMASLVPPAFYLLGHYSQKIILHEITGKKELLLTNIEVTICQVTMFAIIGFLYLMLFLYAWNEQKETSGSQGEGNAITFKLIQSLTATRAILCLLVLLASLCFAWPNYLIYLGFIALITFTNFDLISSTRTLSRALKGE